MSFNDANGTNDADDPTYLGHLKSRYLQFPKAYKERSLFLEVLTKQEYEEWLKNTKYQFESNSQV